LKIPSIMRLTSPEPADHDLNFMIGGRGRREGGRGRLRLGQVIGTSANILSSP
jgi:hypothetical protein